MSKINGSSMLVYADGVLIACQKGCTVNFEQDLSDGTSKDSLGWEEHENGMRRASVDFEALYSTLGLSAVDLKNYIFSRQSVLLLIDGGGFPIIGEADLSNHSLTSPMEDLVSISGSFKFKGGAYMLTGSFANLMTDPDGNGTDYDTFTISGIAVTSAINSAGNAYANSNTISVNSGDVVKVVTFLTLNSGQLPSVAIYDNSSADISNVVALTSGVNIVTLTATNTDASASIRFRNTAAANYTLTSIYVFKV